MLETKASNLAREGMCPHGNFFATCPQCAIVDSAQLIRLPLDEFPVDRIMAIEKRMSGELDPDSERAKDLDAELDALGQIFEDLDIRWYVEGGINLSLLQGKYFRDHKDVDFSVFRDDLEMLSRTITEKGYGIFVPGNSPQEAQDSGFIDLVHVESDELMTLNQNAMVIPLDGSGKIRRPFTYFDLHLLDLDIDGNVVDNNGFSYPNELFTSSTIVKKNGRDFSLQPTPVLLFQKLVATMRRQTVSHDGNGYDWKDIEAFASFMKKSQKSEKLPALLQQIRRLYEAEFLPQLQEDQRTQAEIAFSRFEEILT